MGAERSCSVCENTFISSRERNTYCSDPCKKIGASKKALAYASARRAAQPELVRAQKRKSYVKHAEKTKKTVAAWKHANPDKAAEHVRTYQKTPKGRAKEKHYRVLNEDVLQAKNQLRKKGLPRIPELVQVTAALIKLKRELRNGKTTKP